MGVFITFLPFRVFILWPLNSGNSQVEFCRASAMIHLLLHVHEILASRSQPMHDSLLSEVVERGMLSEVTARSCWEQVEQISGKGHSICKSRVVLASMEDTPHPYTCGRKSVRSPSTASHPSSQAHAFPAPRAFKLRQELKLSTPL